MAASAVGAFAETFEWALEGAAAPVRLEIRGQLVPPAIQVCPHRCGVCTHDVACGPETCIQKCEMRSRSLCVIHSWAC